MGLCGFSFLAKQKFKVVLSSKGAGQLKWVACSLHCAYMVLPLVQADLGSTALHWGPEEEDNAHHLSSIRPTKISVIVVFWGIISDNRENGRDN